VRVTKQPSCRQLNGASAAFVNRGNPLRRENLPGRVKPARQTIHGEVQSELERAPSETGVVEDSSNEMAAKARWRIKELLQRPFDVRSIALTGLFLLAIFYTIRFARSLLLPLVLALLLSYLLRPIVRALAKLKIPPWLGAALLLLSLVGAIGYGISLLAEPAAGWLEKAPYSLQEFQQRLEAWKKPMEKVAQASGAIENLTTPNPQPSNTPTVEVKQHPVSNLLMVQTPEFIISAVTMLILLYFLLAYDGVFLGKLIKLLPTLADKKRAVSIANEIEAQVSRYLFTVTMINCCLGVAVGTTVGLLGLRNPLMWGALVAVLNFVPYLGAFTGIICMTLGAVLSFDNLSYALIFPAFYLTLAILEGNFITPMVMGRSLTLNPVIVLLSLTFWGWMWGIVGVILAVPILAAFKIFCAHIKPMEPLAEFLS
jgi:predicted PurR-regulated permease PerM